MKLILSLCLFVIFSIITSCYFINPFTGLSLYNSDNPAPSAAPFTVNLAFNKTALASTAQSANPAKNAIDNNTTSTRWCSSGLYFPSDWSVDLGNEYNITHTVIFWEKENYYYQYYIEYSKDNTNWTIITDNRSNISPTKIKTDYFTVKARYIKITITAVQQPPSSENWPCFYEVQVCGY